MREICLHGRGGQGAVMASELLVHALVAEGNYGQSIPSYGFERRGAPLKAFVKLDDKPIRERVQVYEPDGVIVLDESLLGQVPIFESIKADSFAVINSRRRMDLSEVPPEVTLLCTIDANRIAIDIFRTPITNTIMLGAFAAGTGLVRLDSLKEAIAKFFPKQVVEKNLEAVERGYREAEVQKRQEEKLVGAR